MARWLKGLAWTVVGIGVLWALGWLALPPLLKWQLQTRGSAALGRTLTVERVSVHPWNLDLAVHGVVIAAREASDEPLLRIARVHANASAASLFRLAPVVEVLDVDGLDLRLARVADGRYDIDDLIQRFTPQGAPAEPSQPARFALYNVTVRDARARFDDRPVGRVHTLEDLQLALPFVSNLPAHVEVNVQPRLAFKLNGAAFDSGAQVVPFAQSRRGELKLRVDGLDVAPYLGYLPKALPLRLTQGRLSTDLTLAFEQPAGAAPAVVLRGSAAARDVALTEPAGAPLLAWRQLQIGLKDVRPLARKLEFDALRIEGAQLHVARDAQGRIVLLQTAPAPRGEAPAAAASAASDAKAAAANAASAWQVKLDALEVADARVVWNDAAVQPAAALTLEALSLQLKQLAWPVAAPVPVLLAATLRAPDEAAPIGQIKVEGSATPRQAKLDATLTDLVLDALAPYAAQTLTPRVHGRVSAQAQIDWSADEQAPRLKLHVAKATLDALQLLPGSGRRALDGPAGGASLAQASVDDVSVDLLAHTVDVGQLRLDRPSMVLVRDAQGQLNVAQWPRAGEPTAPGAAALARQRAEGSWRVALQQINVERGQLRFSDAAVRADDDAEPLRIDVDQLRVNARNLAWHGNQPVKPGAVQFSARIGQAGLEKLNERNAGTVQWKGEVGARPLQASGELQLTRLPVHLLEPYLGVGMPVTVLRAEAGYSGRVAVRQLADGLDVTAAGNVLLGDVHVNTRGSGTPVRAAPTGGPDELLAWQSFALKELKFAMKPGVRPSLEVGQAVLSDFYSRLVVTEQGRFILQAPAPAGAASAPATTAAPASAAVAAASAPAAGSAGNGELPLDLSVGGTQLVNGRVDFSDYFVRPNFSAALTDLNGRLGALSSTTRDMAEIDLRGRIAGTGLLQIGGRINPTVRPPAMDMKASATDLELAPLSPYAGKYAGYAIERGKLSVTVAYKIEADGKLDARNQVVLNQLTFGDRIESPSATKLPVLLAVALLKDRHGVIDIDLPISGSINDPQFSVFGIVIKIIGNLLVKALTAPFALLAGGGRDDLSVVEFVPGTTTISDDGRQTIDKVAKALNERPALKMTVTGSSDATSEGGAYQRAALHTRLATERRREDLRAGVAASAPAALSGAERARVLKSVYRQTELPDKPRNVIGLTKDIPEAEMEALLLKQYTATADAMRELALQRGLAVRDALVAQGLPGERLFLAAPKPAAAVAATVAAGGTGAASSVAAEPAKGSPGPHAQLSLSAN